MNEIYEIFDDRYRPMIKLLHAEPMLIGRKVSAEDKAILAELQELQVVLEDDGCYRLTEAINKLLSK